MELNARVRMRAQNLDPAIREKILELVDGTSIRKIAECLGLSRKLIIRVLKDAGKLPPKVSPRTNLLDPFRKAVEDRVGKGLTASRILREIKELGYQGGRTILAQCVSSLRVQKQLKNRRQIKRRFETPAALESQIDWSPGTVTIGGKATKIHVLGIILAHCRKLFYGIYREERLPILLEGLATGFEYFDGVTLRCVFDNMSTVTLGRIGRDRKPIWNPRFLEFARHYGFEPYLCAVGDPDRKGKKEKAFRLVFDDFLKGSDFESWDDMQGRLKRWLDHTPEVGNLRNHGTTGLIPNEAYLAEKDLLIRLPEHRFPIYEEEMRAVDRDSTLSVRGVRYTVPAVLAFRQATVRLYADYFEVLDHRGMLHMSRRYLDPAKHPEKLVIDPTHYAGLSRRPRDGNGARLDQAFIERFPTLEHFVDGLKAAMKSIAPIHLRKLLRLAEIYGQTTFLAAATKAQEFKRFDSHAVKRILEQEHPLPPEDLSPPCGGLGPLLLGDVEESNLDEYAHLDRQEVTNKKDTDDDQQD